MPADLATAMLPEGSESWLLEGEGASDFEVPGEPGERAA
jgi:hypothetical protein